MATKRKERALATTKNFGLYITEPGDDPFVLDWRNAIAGNVDSNMMKIDEALGQSANKRIRYQDLSSSTVAQVYQQIQSIVESGGGATLRYEDYYLQLIEQDEMGFVFGYILDDTGKKTTVRINSNSYSVNEVNMLADTVSASETKAVKGSGIATYVVDKINEAIGAILIDKS